MLEYLLRFAIGGVAVSLFAILSDISCPKSFAGLFGAAPSIALSTLALALYQSGPAYAAREGLSMIIGSAALGLCCMTCCYLMVRRNAHALSATAISLLVWAAIAFGAEWAFSGFPT